MNVKNVANVIHAAIEAAVPKRFKGYDLIVSPCRPVKLDNGVTFYRVLIVGIGPTRPLLQIPCVWSRREAARLRHDTSALRNFALSIASNAAATAKDMIREQRGEEL